MIGEKKMRNSKYTKEFKDSTVQLAMNSDESMAKISEDLGVHIKTLYAWVRTYKREHNIEIGHSRTSVQSTSKESLNEENARLRKENKLLKQERDILKKATAYFAKETL